MKRLVCLLVVAAITGCASNGEYDAYLRAQSQANTMHMQSQKPLVEIEAMEGQQITGLKSVRVYAPSAAPVIQQAKPNEWAAVASQALSVVGTVGGIVATGKAAVGIAREVRLGSTAGYSHVQAPTTTTTNTMSNSQGVLGSGAVDMTHTPTVVNQPAPVIVTQPDPVVVKP